MSKLERQIKASISTNCDNQESRTLNKEIEKQFSLAKSEYECERDQERFKKGTPSHPAEAIISPQKVGPTFKISPDTTGGNWELSSSERLPIPSGLKEILRDLDLVAEHSADRVVQGRARLDAILFKALATAIISSADAPIHSVYLQTDKYINMPWESDTGLQFLWGRVDYSLWYGGPGKMETNFVVCAASLGQISYYRVLTYMGELHKN
ncbi:hypothetical protein AbraIFM66951_005619 [Aspergillus brasiliensis]|nr:hypothetical protein AbraIFM66951_005619 [Aspergillus brasiliensis]